MKKILENIQERSNQKNSVVLPVGYPQIKSYTHYSSIMSVLSVYPESEAWIYNHFCNLWGYSAEVNYTRIRYSSFAFKKVCPFLDYFSLPGELTAAGDVCKTIIACLKAGFYVFVSYDEYYIPQCAHYHKLHSNHQLFIYGYDADAELFFANDFFQWGILSFEKISFSDVDMAVSKVNEVDNKDHYVYFDIFKFKHNSEYIFDNKLLIKEIEDFLYSKFSFYNFEQNILSAKESEDIKNGKIIFGLANYDVVIKWLQSILEQNMHIIDVRPLYVLFEHKEIMRRRVRYLEQHQILPNAQGLKDKFDTLFKICDKNKNLFLKYALKQDTRILANVISSLTDMKTQDEAVMNEFLLLMKECCNTEQR